MAVVKERRARRRPPSRISAKNQITIPVKALRKAGLAPGTPIRIEAEAPGRLLVVRDDDPIARLSGMFTGVYPKGYLKKLRGEWRY